MRYLLSSNSLIDTSFISGTGFPDSQGIDKADLFYQKCD